MTNTQSPARPGAHSSAPPRGPTFWIGLIIGWAIIGFGIHNVVRSVPGLRDPSELWRALVGGLVVHDGLWVPLAVAVGWVTARALPTWTRSPVRVGLALSAMISVATIPVTRRYGAIADNPSVDPNNSTAGLFVILAIIWAAVAVWTGVRFRRPRVKS